MFLSVWKKHSIESIVVTVLVLAIVFLAGMYAGSRGVTWKTNGTPISTVPGTTVPPGDINLDPLWRTWQVLDSKFVPATSTDVVSKEEQLYGAIQGLTNSFGDPYTVFLPPEDSKIFEDDISGNFEGVGMEIGIRDSILTVISPIKNSPAEQAGILAGDKILQIDDTGTSGMSVDRAVKLIRGEKGTKVVLTVLHEGADETEEISIIRDVINIPTIETQLRDDGVFVITLNNFSAVSTSFFQRALREFAEAETKDLILDLRGNPGGFLQSSVIMASWFLPVGKIVVIEDFGNGEKTIYRSRGFNVFDDTLDMVVLINRGSASASEILAGALSQHGVATLVGERTFGKGSVQELVNITDDTSLKVTVARWVTPSGISISAGGLTPDIEVERTLDDIEAGRDPQLEKAVEILLNR